VGVGGFAEHANVPFGIVFGDNGDIVNVVHIIHVYLFSFSISTSTRISPINGTSKPFIRILSDKKLW
jgi:hypothetical protein